MIIVLCSTPIRTVGYLSLQSAGGYPSYCHIMLFMDSFFVIYLQQKNVFFSFLFVINISDATPYMLHDEEGENQMEFSLAVSLHRRSIRTRPLLHNLTVYCSPSVEPPVSGMRSVVECAGGKVGCPAARDSLQHLTGMCGMGTPWYMYSLCSVFCFKQGPPLFCQSMKTLRV